MKLVASLPIQLYLVDAFTYAASVTGASSVFRSALGFVFPLFGQQMTNKLGYGGACTVSLSLFTSFRTTDDVDISIPQLLAGVAIVIGIPFPIYIYLHGAEIRAKSKYTR